MFVSPQRTFQSFPDNIKLPLFWKYTNFYKTEGYLQGSFKSTFKGSSLETSVISDFLKIGSLKSDISILTIDTQRGFDILFMCFLILVWFLHAHTLANTDFKNCMHQISVWNLSRMFWEVKANSSLFANDFLKSSTSLLHKLFFVMSERLSLT